MINSVHGGIMSEQNLEKKQFEKSALYPAVTIHDCVEFISQVDGLGGKAVSYATMLGVLGLSSPTTKSFIYRISACKQYGFITTSNSTIQLTEIARSILHPTSENEKQLAMIKAFRNPPLYAKLIERFSDKALPIKTHLANILMADYKIVKSVKDTAADCFLSSAESLGLIINGVLHYGEPNTNEPKLGATETSPNTITANQPDEMVGESTSKKEGYSFEIPTLSGSSAKFYIPAEVSLKDLDFMSLYIKEMLPKFIENLKEQINEEPEV